MATPEPRPLRAYRYRQPERTVLYRALAHHFETFIQVYDDRFLDTHGPLRACVQPAVYRYLDCGIFDRGFARARCPDCGHDFMIAYSCKLRCLCPSCHKKRELLWAEWASEELLEEVPHRQVVLTIPKRLRLFFRYDRKLLGELASCAWRAIRLFFAAHFDRDDIAPGAIGFIQTAGQFLRWHPHLHILLTDGVFLPDGSFRHLLYFNDQHLEKLFRAEVLRMLLERGLISEDTVDNLLSWKNTGFSAHGATRAESREDAVRLGRYMGRCPLVLERLCFDEVSGEVAYQAAPSRRSGPFGPEARWGVLDFIAHVLDHLPEPRQQLTRYWGRYANAARGKRRRDSQADQDLALDTSPNDKEEDDADGFRRRCRLTWAQLIKKVYEFDPLLCRFCGAEMKIIAFITAYPSIRRILDHIGLERQEPQPLAHGPPLVHQGATIPF